LETEVLKLEGLTRTRAEKIARKRRAWMFTLLAAVAMIQPALAQGQDLSQPATDPVDLNISLHRLPKRFFEDQRNIWLFPRQLAEGHHLLPTLAVVGATAALITSDAHATPYFRTHARNLEDVNDVVRGSITSGATALVPLTMVAVGYLHHNSYLAQTGLLAGEAFVNTEVLGVALKAITNRTRPIQVSPGQQFSDTFFSGTHSRFSSSFPSGHALNAFAVATVVSYRYRRHRWVPLLAYGAATVVGLSRLSTSAHFPSDIFLGSTLGYAIARFDVLRNDK